MYSLRPLQIYELKAFRASLLLGQVQENHISFFFRTDEKEYEELTELKATQILNKYTLREDEFEELKDNLVYLLDSLRKEESLE